MEEAANESFKPQYPKARIQYLEEHKIERREREPTEVSARRRINALQFAHNDGKQLIQVRSQGFSFNRLAPYTSLDDYLPEIQRTWSVYSKIASPVQIRAVRLRYINRIEIPLTNKMVELTEYFRIGPKLPEEDKLVLMGFLHQHTAEEPTTGHIANIVLTSQPVKDGRVPVIFDITVTASENGSVEYWTYIHEKIMSLRDFKILDTWRSLGPRIWMIAQATIKALRMWGPRQWMSLPMVSIGMNEACHETTRQRYWWASLYRARHWKIVYQSRQS